MIRRQHLESDFFDQAEAMREFLDASFKNTYTNRIDWQYFCDPRMYTYLRTAPQSVFPRSVFDAFMDRLRSWCMDALGLAPMSLPYLHLMVNGCRLGLHSDFHNGVWGYVYSLTRWEHRRFCGGETLLLRDGVPSYKRHHVHGDALYELIPANFNQLFIFDDRIVHATPTIEGSMDPLDGRIAMVGHIRATSPVVSGSIPWPEVRKVVLEAMPNLRDRVRSYRDVQGTITFRVGVSPAGLVESVATLTDNLVTSTAGYDRADDVATVRSIVQQAVAGLRFPGCAGTAFVVLPVLIPLPDLSAIEFSVPHQSSRDAIHAWAMTSYNGVDRLEFRGSWEGYTFVVREPVAGSIRFEPHEILFSFDPPMWVPSQRQSFQITLTEWANTAVLRVDEGR